MDRCISYCLYFVHLNSSLSVVNAGTLEIQVRTLHHGICGSVIALVEAVRLQTLEGLHRIDWVALGFLLTLQSAAFAVT